MARGPHPQGSLRTIGVCAAILLLLAPSRAYSNDQAAASDAAPAADAVLARIREHGGRGRFPVVLMVDANTFAPGVWNRVKNLVAFRIHRPAADGTTLPDAAIYLVRDSPIYLRAAEALRNRTTNHEYVWCLLAATLAHEAAHTAPNTERQALSAELAELERCLQAGHLHAADGWNAGRYVKQIEAKLRKPREHY